MRSWFYVWLVSTLILGTTLAQYDSCHFDDYHSALIIGNSMSNYFYLSLPGVCEPRGDVSLRLIRVVSQPDDGEDLFVDFRKESDRPIRNRFNVTPSCVAFSVGNVLGSSTLMEADNGAPLLTIGDTIELLIPGGASVSFNASEIDIITRVQRLQICMNGTHAVFYLDCKEIETKPFTVSNSGINFVSILGERNSSTLEYENFFNGAVQQLYTVQCTNQEVDLEVLSILQCQSIPANGDDCGTGCSQRVRSNLTQVLNEVVSELLRPEDMQAFCDVIVWRNVPAISPMNIIGYDVKLFNPVTGRKVIRKSPGYATFYTLKDQDACFKQEMTTVQIRANLIDSDPLDPFSVFSLPINLRCGPPAIPSVYLELNGDIIYQNKSTMYMSDIGENERALQCRTNKPGCCKTHATGEFFYPNGVMVPKRKLSPEFYRDRGSGVVRLNRRATSGFERESMMPPLEGLYCCQVLDACDDVQTVCIYLINNIQK